MVLTAGLATKFALGGGGESDLCVCVHMCAHEQVCVLSRMVVRLSSRKIIELTV